MSKTPILAVAPAGLELLAADDLDPAVAALTAAAVQAESVEDDPVDDAVDPEDDEPAEEAKAAAPVESMAGVLAQLNTELVGARVKLEQVTTERDNLSAANAGLRQIVLEQTQNLRVKLGGGAGTDLATLTDSSLCAAYEAVKADFMQRFRPGPTSAVPQKDSPLPKAAVTRLDLAVKRATSFGK